MPRKKAHFLHIGKSSQEKRLRRRMKYAEMKAKARGPPYDSNFKTTSFILTVDAEEQQRDASSEIHLACNWDTPVYYPANEDMSCNVSVDTDSTTTPLNIDQNIKGAQFNDTLYDPGNEDMSCNLSVDTDSTTTHLYIHQNIKCEQFDDTLYHPANEDMSCNVLGHSESNTTPFNIHQNIKCEQVDDTMTTSLPTNSDEIANNALSEHKIPPFDPYTSLRRDLSKGTDPPFILDPHHRNIHFLQLYHNGNRSVVKITVTILEDFTAVVNVHGKDISREHELWSGLPDLYDSVTAVHGLLQSICNYSVCIGNPDADLQDIVPLVAEHSDSDSLSIFAYREGNFCANQGDLSYSSTIRSGKCCLLVKSARCANCALYRRALRKRKHRQEERMSKSEKTDFIHSRIPHASMSYNMLQQKIQQQKCKIKSLESELDALRKRSHSEIMTNESPGKCQSGQM